jgi:L-histidine N-alpha-methyltransferase
VTSSCQFYNPFQPNTLSSSQEKSESIQDRISIDNQIDPASEELALVELQKGLLEQPRKIPTKFLYDKRGSRLFEQITALEEYYPTRVEHSLLQRYASEIQTLTSCEELVELGSGAATKTRVLLDAMRAAGMLRLYIPFDVSESEIHRVAEELAREYPSLHVHGIVADFVHHLSAIPAGPQRLIMLLGSTIGNFPDRDAVDFLSRISAQMESSDSFLIGVDLIKDIPRIEAAYNDASGITAEFNRNILSVVNRLAEADFQPAMFKHLAFFNADLHRIEMHLIATKAMHVELRSLDLEIEIQQGEALFTEISCKYERSMVESMLSDAGFELIEWFSDPEDLFALALARKRSSPDS